MKRVGEHAAKLALIAAVIVLGAKFAAAEDAPPQKGGTAIFVLGTDPPLTNPDASSGYPDNFVGCILYQGLIQERTDGEIRPLLAKSWSISPDGLTYTFDLVAAKWQDGKPFTSADVKFALMEVAAKYSPIFSLAGKMVDGIDTPAPDRVVIRLKRPYGPFLITMSCAKSGAIVPKHIYEGTNVLANPATTTKPIGTGAFKLTEWAHGDHMRFDRNQDYWEPGKPYLDALIGKIIPQPSARTQALRAGEVDFASYYFFPSADEKAAMQDPNLQVVKSNTPQAMDFLFLNVKQKPLDNKKVRHALLMATDRDYLLKYGWLDRGTVGVMPFTAGIAWAADPNIDYRKMYPFDQAKANALFDEAGLKRGPDGMRAKLRLAYANDEFDYVQVSAALKSMWKSVGIDVTVEAMERATMLKRVYMDHDFDLVLNGYGSFNDPAIGLARAWVTSSINTNYGNASQYSNPVVDELFAQAEGLTSQTERGVLYKRIQGILADNLSAFTLHDKALNDVASAKLHGAWGEAHYSTWREVWLAK